MAKVQYSPARLAPEYDANWAKLRVTNVAGARAACDRILRGKKAYVHTQEMTGVPWPLIGLMHLRESNCNFGRWLHNGDRMRDSSGRPIRTRQIPANRPPNPNVDWFAGAYDCLVTVKHFDRMAPWTIAKAAYVLESMNGFGYRNPKINIRSPYLYGGSNLQQRGKFYADRKYSAAIMDPQMGCLTVLKMLFDMDPDAEASFDGARVSRSLPLPLPAPAPAKEFGVSDELSSANVPVPPVTNKNVASSSPKADDPTMDEAVKPLRKSKTIWGTVMGWFGGVFATLQGMWDYIATPWGFAALAAILAVLSVGAFLVIRGRIDTDKLIKHLAPDDDADDSGDDQ